MLAFLEKGILWLKRYLLLGGYFTFDFYYTTKAYTHDIIFHLNDSLADNTFFHWLNLFDIVPSYNIPQQWRGFRQGGEGLNSFYKGELFK